MTMIDESLIDQAEYPVCKVDWAEITDSLHSGKGHPDYDIALFIIGNCETCKRRFADELERLKESV